MDPDFSTHPTSFLPPLARLSTHSTHNVADAVTRLRNLYWPPKPPPLTLPRRTITIPRHIHDESVPDSGYASAEDEDEEEACITLTHIDAAADPEDPELELLRADSLQRAFAIRWITGFISRAAPWIDLAPNSVEHALRACLLDEATALLSAFAGDDNNNDTHTDTADTHASTIRTFAFPTPSGETITVRLNDAPLLDDDHTAVGLQSWGSAIRLGARLCTAPAVFSLAPPRSAHRPLRVLELGAGTGLLSILAAQLLSLSPSATVVATDYHPAVLANLARNVTANPTCTPIRVHALDWEKPTYDALVLARPFDVVLAADVVYHPLHARWIWGCVGRLLRRPGGSGEEGEGEGGVFWLIVAVRGVGRHEGLDRSVVEVFGEGEGEREEEGWRLRILEMEEAGKMDGVGRADESGYKLFKIGWKKVDARGRRDLRSS